MKGLWTLAPILLLLAACAGPRMDVVGATPVGISINANNGVSDAEVASEAEAHCQAHGAHARQSGHIWCKSGLSGRDTSACRTITFDCVAR